MDKVDYWAAPTDDGMWVPSWNNGRMYRNGRGEPTTSRKEATETARAAAAVLGDAVEYAAGPCPICDRRECLLYINARECWGRYTDTQYARYVASARNCKEHAVNWRNETLRLRQTTLA